MISRRTTILGLLAVATGTSLAACTSPDTVGGDTLDANGFSDLVAKPGVVVLDVRTPAEYADGHLKDAMNLDVNAPEFGRQVSALDKAATYAVYCRSGSRSATALKLMKQTGIKEAYHLAGGIGSWQSAGYAVVR